MVFLYIVYVFLLGGLGGLYFFKNQNKSGFFFLIFSISISLWFLFFLLNYSSIQNLNLLLSYFRGSYYLSINALYNFLLFVFFYSSKREKISSSIVYISIFISCILGYIYIGTPLILESLYFFDEKQDWYENNGILHNLHLVLSLLFLPLLSIISFKKFKTLSYVNKVRLSHILLGMFLFTTLCFTFLLILPIFGYRMFERYIALFFLPFIFLTTYSINRYHFVDIRITSVRILSFLFSLGMGIFVTLIMYSYIPSITKSLEYWNFPKSHLILATISGIITYIGIYHGIKKYVFPFLIHNVFSYQVQKIQDRIPFISDLDSLNYTLEKDFRDILSINYAYLDTQVTSFSELSRFFKEKHTQNKIFINDIVFLYENIFPFDIEILNTELPKKTSLAFPVFHNMDLVGIFFVGHRFFKEQYSSQEINIFIDFSHFLEGHLKYIEIYSQIHDLNVNLDKKVDEKTMQYNTLIQKQKEYISMISHELRSPVTSSLFLAESLLSAVKSEQIEQAKVVKNLELLDSELGKTAEFIKNLFSVEKYDLGKVELFPTSVDISSFLVDEQEVFEKNYPQTHFFIEQELGEFNIDEIQFRQVIHNLVHNALKFASKQSSCIHISLYRQEKKIILDIEDNGVGIHDVDISKIFDKYASGSSSSSGLGLGLYLCKRIVELHHWNIVSGISSKLGGAKFTIEIS